MLAQYFCPNFLCPEKNKTQEVTHTLCCSSCQYTLIKRQPDKVSTMDGQEHYGGYQVLELICAAGYGKGFCLGNSIKYLSRAMKKDNFKKDLLKAQVYLNYYIDNELEKK